MAVTDLWRGRDGKPTARDGRGMRWRASLPGRPSKAFRTKPEAVEYERTLRQAGARPAAGTVDDLVDTYLAGRQHLSRDGLNALRAAAASIRPAWGAVRADQVERAEVQAWLSGLQAQYGSRRGDGTRALRPASVETKRKALQVFRGALAIAVERGWIDRSASCLVGGRSLRWS